MTEGILAEGIMDWHGQTLGLLPDWGPACVRDLSGVLQAAQRPFPCTFAVAAARRGTLRFGFVEDSADERAWWPLLDILTQYLKVYKDLSRDTSLVVFFRPDDRPGAPTMADCQARFWRVLQFLHEHDDQPWPQDIPTGADDARWEFSFGGTPIFVVCSTPRHAARRSRHSDGFLITFQPRWVFEGLAADTARGLAARRTIRRRLAAYDTVPASPHLGDYGNPANREWRQYFLTDDNDDGEQPARCPFRYRAGGPW